MIVCGVDVRDHPQIGSENRQVGDGSQSMKKSPVMLLKPPPVEYNVPENKEGSVEATAVRSSTAR